ncbi:UNVERIFIED_CONTAM: hypothetical protein FKN15_045821 [Acipenser sinensis]
MPPKKKEKSAEKGEKKEKGKVKRGTPAGEKKIEQPLTELEKEFYLIQIRDLEERLERYQHKCDELEVREKDFSSEFERLTKDKKEIVSFLKRSLDQRADELADLTDRLIGLQQAKEAEKEACENQLAQLRHEFQESKDQLTSENMILAGKLASVEEFRLQKEELMGRLTEMEEQLEKQGQEHQTTISNLEKKAVVDKDRLKKEMMVRVAAVAAEFRRVSDKQMAETTKRMIRENVSVTAQLSKSSSKSLELLQENQALKELEERQRQQLGVLEHGQKDLARKSLSNQKVVRILTEKCKEQQYVLQEYMEKEHEYDQLKSDHATLQQEVEVLRQELVSRKDEQGVKHAEAEDLKRCLIAERQSRGQLERVLKEAAFALKEALLEGPSTMKEADPEIQTHVRRRQMMEKLLSLLDSAALLGVGPALKEFKREAASSHEHRTEPGSDSCPYVLSAVLQLQNPLWFGCLSNMSCVILQEGPSTMKEADPEIQTHVRRRQMMEKLLSLLDSAALLGVGPALKEFKREAASSHEHRTEPGSDRLSVLLKAPRLLPHYRIGDLGLVPRPEQTLATTLNKVAPLSRSTQLELHKHLGQVRDGSMFSTAVSEKQLEEAREKSRRRLFRSSRIFELEEDKKDRLELCGRSIIELRAAEHYGRGVEAVSKADWERAVHFFTKTINLQPQQTRLYVCRAEAYLQLCDFQSAALNYRKASALEPQSEAFRLRLAFIFYLQGQCLFDHGRHLDALESFAKATELRPDYRPYHMRSLACLAAIGRHSDCLRLVSKRIETEMDDPELYILSARLHKHFNQLTICYHDVKAALALAPGIPEGRSLLMELEGRAEQARRLALSRAVAGNLQEALQKINTALENNPEEVQYYLFRAEAYLQLCDFQSAALNYRKASALEPQSEAFRLRLAFIFYLQGQCLFDHGRHLDALESFAKATELRPDYRPYHMRSLACLAAIGRHSDCLRLVSKRIETEMDDPELYILSARLHKHFNQLTICYHDVKAALALAPGIPEGRSLLMELEGSAEQARRLALSRAVAGNLQEALQKINTALENNPEEVQYYLFRGTLYRRLKDFSTAIDDFILALDRSGGEEGRSVQAEAQRQLLLTYNDFAVHCFTRGFYEEAVMLLNKAIGMEKREKGLYINRGDCFFKQRELEFALADYQQAEELDPLDRSIKIRFAVVYSTMGQRDYESGRQISPSALQAVPLLARLYPGCTVTDILSSEAGEMAKMKLDVSLQACGLYEDPSSFKRDPHKPPPKHEKSSEEPADAADTENRIAPCIGDTDLHHEIMRSKIKINRAVKCALQERRSLRSDGPRVSALAQPASAEPPQDAYRPYRWKKFNTAVGLQFR